MKFETKTICYGDFLTPPTYFRPAPFWSINDEITPQETARQMEDMRSVGLSGGFFHARAGLKTEYMGKAWFEAMRAALDVAEKQDGYLWLYDEDMWPSGAAGGEVTRLNPEYRRTMLDAELFYPGDKPQESADRTIRAAFRIDRDGVALKSAQQITREESLAASDGERLVLFKVCARESGQWGAPYANLLHPDAVKDFIRKTHDVYARELGHAFGKRIPGIFTDEPNIEHSGHELPWYEGLIERYKVVAGRDLIADLPYLFFNAAISRKVRLLFRRTVAGQYVESFSKAIFDWCESHNIAYTGHYNAEDTLNTVLHNHSGNLMAHYRYQQIPGIDHLFRRIETMLLTAKCATSVARQLGRKQVLSEIFGGMRHSATLADFRWVGNYDLAMGVNCFCPHLSWYTMTGRRKRDWPQNFNYQQTYWRDLKPLHDYFARLSAILTQGRPQVDLLMLHPMDAASASYRFGVRSSRQGLAEDFSMTTYYDKKLRGLLGVVLMAGYECDLGDEDNLAEFGKVESGRLQIGEMAYRVVIVPPGHTWRPGTYELLKRFVAAGGTLIFTGDLPTELDADAMTEAWNELAAKSVCVPAAESQLLAAVDRIARPAFRLWTSDGRHTTDTLVQHRFDGTRHLVFVTNIHQHRAQDYEIAFSDMTGPLAIWDAHDGSRRKAELNGDRYRFTLAGGEAILLARGADVADGAMPVKELLDLRSARVESLGASWKFRRDEPNALIIDRVRYSLDAGRTWSAVMPDYQARREIARGFAVDKAARLQPWRSIADGHGGTRGEVTLGYRFASQVTPSSPVFLVLERMDKARSLRVNGRKLDHSGFSWQWDRQFHKVEITSLLQTGENLVEITLDYDISTEIEAAYIIGDFAVKLTPSMQEGELVAEPQELKSGSWVEQGYPFFTGRMTYLAKCEHRGGRVALRLPAAAGVLFKVRIGGQDAGSICWAPYQLEITPWLKPGMNELEIEVVASRQNLTGPLHGKEGEDSMPGPFAFEEPWFLRPQFSLCEYGLLNGAELLRLP